MHKFTDFISAIIGDMKMSNKRRCDLTDEFMDHLEMLKQEYINSGLGEEEAENQAIKNFGDIKMLRQRLHSSLFSYRTISNTLFGLLLLIIIYRVGSHIPVYGVDPRDLTLNMTVFKYSALGIMPIFFFMGYFLPIIINKKGIIRYIIIFALCSSSILALWFEFSINKLIDEYVFRLTDIVFFTGIIMLNILESILGYGFLKLTHQVSLAINQKYF